MSLNTSRAFTDNSLLKATKRIVERRECKCPTCGRKSLQTIDECRNLMASQSSTFFSGLVAWLNPPTRPVRPVSNRHSTSRRNGIAFAFVWMAICTVAWIAFQGTAPNSIFGAVVLAIAVYIGVRTWQSESKLAAQEDEFLIATYIERYRAYLSRRRIWARLRYCSDCRCCVDPVTRRTKSLFEIHELINGV